MDVAQIRDEMTRAAQAAANAYFAEKLGGRDQYSCGFSWVNVIPAHKGNTRAGRAERAVLEQLGFRKDWTGREYQLWNPSGHNCQNIDVKEQGSRAAAEVLRRYGMNAYSDSRLD